MYPEPRAAAPGLWSQQRLQGLVAAMLRLPGERGRCGGGVLLYVRWQPC